MEQMGVRSGQQNMEKKNPRQQGMEISLQWCRHYPESLAQSTRLPSRPNMALSDTLLQGSLLKLTA